MNKGYEYVNRGIQPGVNAKAGRGKEKMGRIIHKSRDGNYQRKKA